MPKSFICPHGITLKEGGVLDTVPIIEVKILNKNEDWLSLFLIIDSGATISAFPKSDADFFGIDVYKGRRIFISGFGGEKIAGWQHDIVGKFNKVKIQFPAVFLDLETAPRVLGRAGIFEQFMIIFQEKKRRSIFIGENQKDVAKIEKIIENI